MAVGATVAIVRQRIAAAIEGAEFQPDPDVTAMALHESRWDLVANGAEPQIAGHGSFAVLALSTKFGSEVDASERSARVQGRARTDIGIRWLFRLRASRYVGDFDDALGAEEVIYQRLTSHRSDGLRVSVLELRREVIGDGTWVRGEVVVRTDHQLDI